MYEGWHLGIGGRLFRSFSLYSGDKGSLKLQVIHWDEVVTT